MAHSPSTWKVSLVDDTLVIDAAGNEVAAIDGDYNQPDTWPVMEANARLIAAAPDLLQALKRVEPNIGWRSPHGDDPAQYYCEFCAAHHEDFREIVHDDGCVVSEIRAAIAKATGGAS